MGAADFAALMKDYGSVGLNAILLYAVVYLYKGKEALHDRLVDKFGKLLIAIEASTAALVESRGTLQTLGGAIEALGKAVTELSHENETHASEVRHGLGNVSQSMSALREKLAKICEMIGKTEEQARKIDYVIQQLPASRAADKQRGA